MRKVALGLVVLAAIGYVGWMKFRPQPPRLKAALEEAKRDNKLVLLDFTGSDWCEWCMKLDAEALGKPAFLDYASKYLVTLVVDFPTRHELEDDLKKQNKALKEEYDVEGFPTLVLISPNGKVVWKQAGYVDGGPYAVIAPINRNRMALGLPNTPELPAGSNVVAETAKPGQERLGRLPSTSDPAAATSATGLPADAPKLQGLLYSRSNPSAILGGKQCNEGDTVDGMRIVKIQKDRVVVEWQGRKEELMMP